MRDVIKGDCDAVNMLEFYSILIVYVFRQSARLARFNYCVNSVSDQLSQSQLFFPMEFCFLIFSSKLQLVIGG